MGRHGDGTVWKPKGRKYYYCKNTALGISSTCAYTESKQEAKEKLRSLNGEVRKGLSPSATKIKFAELIRDKLMQMKADNMSSYRNQAGRALNHILPFFGEMLAKDVTAAKIAEYQNFRATQTYSKRKKDGSCGTEKPVSNSEVNRETDLIAQSFNLAIESGKIQMIAPFIKRRKEPAPRSGFLERQQFETLLKFLPWIIAQLCRFYYITGWRHNEGKNLRWSYVSFETARITLPGEVTKSGKPRVFPFTPELETVLSEMREYTDRIQNDSCSLIPWVFHNNGRPIGNFYKAWNTACKRAGLAGTIIHNFRRTAARNLELAGVPRAVAMQMIGMSSESTYRRYRIVAEGETQSAAKLYSEFEQRMRRVK